MYPQLVQQFLQTERLPDSYGEDVQRWYLPFIQSLQAEITASQAGPLLLGINGAQGTGKTTFSNLIHSFLEQEGLKVASLSIDDFYLGKAERQDLAATVHPLLATRGVPGTHDVQRLDGTLTALQAASEGEITILPVFSKAEDDVLPETEWRRISGPVDLILLEGWCVGVPAQTPEELGTAMNRLEAEEDANGHWRHFVNQRLADDYQPIFDKLQRLVMLQAPSFEQVYAWRGLQEQKLRESESNHGSGLMSAEQLRQFIQHYERLTRHCLAVLPNRADTVFLLNQDHRVVARKDRDAPD